MKALRVNIERWGDCYIMEMVDFAIQVDGSSEEECLRQLEHTLAAEYLLGKRSNRLAFRSLRRQYPYHRWGIKWVTPKLADEVWSAILDGVWFRDVDPDKTKAQTNTCKNNWLFCVVLVMLAVVFVSSLCSMFQLFLMP